ncbi:periplasmic heavy metal sensor [bacterium]|nr:periplasmic heavy metal sensor [bacterium]
MKKRYMVIAVILLVIINLSALTTMGYNRYCRYRENCRIREQTGSCGYLCEKLALSDTQVKTMEAARQRFLDTAGKENRELTRARLLLVDELSRDLPDTARIDDLCDRIASIQGRLQRQAARSILNEKMILDPVQRAGYLAIIRSRLLQDNAAAAPASPGAADPACEPFCPQFN